MGKTIGIDLGSTNSCISVYEGNDVIIINNAEGKRTTPSIVAFTKDGERKIGDPAKRQAITNPENTIYSIKRLMGKNYDQVKDINLPYKVVKTSNNRSAVEIDNKQYSPEEISAMILTKLKKSAEEYLGEDVTSAVITVPAYYNNEERESVIVAGKIAGLEVLRIINEPTAAALSFGIDKLDKDMKIAVYDFGGGTMDFSILDFSDNVFEVLATDGDIFLGGDDIDEAIINWLAESFLSEENVDIRKDPMALQRVREASEKAKIELSSSTSTEINLPYIIPVDNVPKHLVKTLTRSEFEKIIDPIITRTLAPCKSAIEKSGLSISDIDEVILVGGSTRIPAIREAVKKLFGKEPNNSVNPDEAVSIGATIQAGVLNGDITDILLLDVTPLSLGIETMGGVMTKLIESNTTIPSRRSETFSTAVDNQSSVEIHIIQGERSMAKDNKSLGRFHLDSIPPSPRGVPQIEVIFDIDANGVLNVSAKDKATGKEQNIRIEASSGLTDDEIDRMRKDAVANEESDKKAKEIIDKTNETESLIFSLEKSIKDDGDKISGSLKERVETFITELKQTIVDKDLEKMDSLKSNSSALLTDLYQEIQNYNSTEPQTTNESDTVSEQDSSTQDIEFEEMNKSSE